jgi:AbrB family looped-hinge helix DNA binding protein
MPGTAAALAIQTVLRDKGQITIPSEIRKAAHLEEGDPVEFLMTSEGILMRPRKTIDSTQAWFWTPAWQQREREATDDIRRGRVTTYKTDEDFLHSFED